MAMRPGWSLPQRRNGVPARRTGCLAYPVIKAFSVAVASLAGCVLAAAGVGLAATGVAQAAPVIPVPGSAVTVAAGALVGTAPASQSLTVQVWLTPDLAGATAFANSVTTPGSPAFHHYLSPNAYTARFGPSAAHAAAVTAWLTAQGLAQVHAGRGRDYVSATGPVSRIQSAFGVQIDKYRVTGANGEPTVIESNDRAVSVPAVAGTRRAWGHRTGQCPAGHCHR